MPILLVLAVSGYFYEAGQNDMLSGKIYAYEQAAIGYEQDISLYKKQISAIEKYFDLLKRPFPANNTVNRFTNTDAVCPLKISVPPDGVDYFFTLVDYESNRKVLTWALCSGAQFEIDIPVGTYKIYYSCGFEWYGEDLQFGQGGRYAILGDSFDFYISGDVANGSEIKLTQRAGGNLGEDELSYEEFMSTI